MIAAISQEPNFDGLNELRTGKDWVKLNEQKQIQLAAAADEKSYAGGDVLNLATVNVAIRHGRDAAIYMHARFTGQAPQLDERLTLATKERMLLDFYEAKDPQHLSHLSVAERFADINKEVAAGFSEAAAKAEASRCMSCGDCFYCENCWKYCGENVIVKPTIKGDPFTLKMEFCQGCKKCAEQCPCGHIDMV